MSRSGRGVLHNFLVCRSNSRFCVPLKSTGRLSRISIWFFGIVLLFTLPFTGCSLGREGARSFRSDHSLDFPTYVRSLRCIMPREEWQELLKMPREDQEKVINRFWRYRDPTPTTAKNERMEEHFSRLEQLRQESLDGNFGSSSLDSDLERIYIKYGQPDEDRDESLLWDHEFYRSFVYGELEYLFTFDRSGSLVWTNFPGVVDLSNFRVCDILPHDYYSFEHGYIEASFAQGFFYEEDMMRVEAYYSFALPDLELHRSAGAFAGSYEKGFLAFGPGMIEKMRVVEEVEVVGSGRITGGKLVTGRLELLLSPGSYRLAISLRDLLSKKIAVCTIDSTPVAQPDSLAVGGPVFGLAPDVPVGEGPFVRHGIGLIPNPSRLYYTDDALLLYMEVYNLEPSDEGVFRYEGTYTVRGKNILRAPRILHEVYSSTDPAPWVLTRIDILGLPPDDYGLEIEVSDRNNGRRVASDVSFRVIAR